MGCEGELEQRGCKVVTVARGTQSSAKQWMDDCNFPYPLYLDLEMNLYRDLGLKRSVMKVWTVEMLVAYAEERLAGVAGNRGYEGDDIHVIAGDYITDSSGKLVFAFNSSSSDDRPSTVQVLGALDAVL